MGSGLFLLMKIYGNMDTAVAREEHERRKTTEIEQQKAIARRQKQEQVNLIKNEFQSNEIDFFVIKV